VGAIANAVPRHFEQPILGSQIFFSDRCRKKMFGSGLPPTAPMGEDAVAEREAEKRRLIEGDYIAQPEDSSLLQLLLEAFAVLERRFNIWDRDEAGMLLFSAVEANLAMSGFINRKALENLWRQVDMDPDPKP
jgi:hypothetical protein